MCLKHEERGRQREGERGWERGVREGERGVREGEYEREREREEREKEREKRERKRERREREREKEREREIFGCSYQLPRLRGCYCRVWPVSAAFTFAFSSFSSSVPSQALRQSHDVIFQRVLLWVPWLTLLKGTRWSTTTSLQGNMKKTISHLRYTFVNFTAFKVASWGWYIHVTLEQCGLPLRSTAWECSTLSLKCIGASSVLDNITHEPMWVILRQQWFKRPWNASRSLVSLAVQRRFKSLISLLLLTTKWSIPAAIVPGAIQSELRVELGPFWHQRNSGQGSCCATSTNISYMHAHTRFQHSPFHVLKHFIHNVVLNRQPFCL
mgnify:CR=1 FL=1